MGKIICLDVGTVRIGIATSDVMQVALPHSVYKRRTPYLDAKYIADLAKSLDAQKFVIGMPLKLDGSEGTSAQMAKDFAESLQKLIDLPIEFQDERLSTVSAERILLETNTSRKDRKGKIDQIAATIILQNYLDKHNR